MYNISTEEKKHVFFSIFSLIFIYNLRPQVRVLIKNFGKWIPSTLKIAHEIFWMKNAPHFPWMLGYLISFFGIEEPPRSSYGTIDPETISLFLHL